MEPCPWCGKTLEDLHDLFLDDIDPPDSVVATCDHCGQPVEVEVVTYYVVNRYTDAAPQAEPPVRVGLATAMLVLMLAAILFCGMSGMYLPDTPWWQVSP